MRIIFPLVNSLVIYNMPNTTWNTPGASQFLWSYKISKCFLILYLIFFLDSPVFTVKPKNTTGFVGEPAWIHCKGEGRPPPSVNYLKSKDRKTMKMKAILNESRFETLPNHTLYIKELKLEDDGPYFCWLTQKHSSISSDFYLTVKGECNISLCCKWLQSLSIKSRTTG